MFAKFFKWLNPPTKPLTEQISWVFDGENVILHALVQSPEGCNVNGFPVFGWCNVNGFPVFGCDTWRSVIDNRFYRDDAIFEHKADAIYFGIEYASKMVKQYDDIIKNLGKELGNND